MNLSGKTNAELIALRQSVEANPDNQQSGSIWLFTASARKKLDAIAWQITHNLKAARELAGNPVSCDGYSGRNSNKR